MATIMPIGNDWCAWFAGTHSKSRINIMQLLQAGELHDTLSVLNSHALDNRGEESLTATPRRQRQR